MGNTAVVLSDRNRNAVPVRRGGTFVDRHRDVPSEPEWENYLRNYTRKMHKNRKCMHCFVEFKNISSLLSHLGNNHHPTVSYSTSSTKSEEPLCVVCRNTFSSVRALQQHLQTPCKGYWTSMDPTGSKDTKVKSAGQKRPKLKSSANESSKKLKVQSKPYLKPRLDPDNFSIPSQLPPSNKKSVKTINPGSCIRQYSRPIIPNTSSMTASNDSVKVVKTLTPHAPCQANKDKMKTVSGKSKSRPTSRGPGRVISSRSLGLVDFDKIRTTARTRNMISGSRSLPDLTNLASKVVKPPKKVESKANTPKLGKNSCSERKVNDNYSDTVPDVTGCNGISQSSSVVEPSRVTQNGLNKEVKSYLILKVMPIVQSQTNKSIMKPILPKQPATPYQKIQPKPQIVLQSTPKPLLVLKIPDCKGTSPQQSTNFKDQNSIFENNPGIKAIKTYGHTPVSKKRKSPSDLSKDDPEFDQEIK